jgi:GntR family transcriptional regulator
VLGLLDGEPPIRAAPEPVGVWPGRHLSVYARSVPRRSLVDATETALRERLAPGRARLGDRLPPEKELAEALGVSRGTLRLALERLESNGEVVRRQGSGTFVGRVALGAAFSEGLEVLESYASLARREGKRLTVRNLQVEQARTPGYVAEALGMRRGSPAPLIQRTLLADGTVAAHMRDIVHPDVEIPPPEELRAAIASGKMVLDVLVERGVPIAFARTQVRPRLVEPGGRLGEAMGATRVTAALELVELMHLAGGQAVQYSISVFAPGSVDLHVMRGFWSPGWET